MGNNTKFQHSRLSESILCALHGMSRIMPHDRNPRAYVLMTLGAVVMTLILRATDVQWFATLISATGAFSAEMMNSAIERICDRQCKDYDEDIRYIKDVAAGGVLFWGFAFWLSCLWVIVTTPVFPGLLARRQEEVHATGVAALIEDGKITGSYAGEQGIRHWEYALYGMMSQTETDKE